ncbi:MAG: tetratricopeptide repeat protein [Bacteroidota bacterium]|nr:tetratricopeptide repeat protein [Bacteroidota bacterium]
MGIKNKQHRKKPENQVKPVAQPKRYQNYIIIAIISLYTILLFSKSINFEFVNYDDTYYVLENQLIKDFSFQGLKNIFTTPVLGMYNPLPFLVYAIEHKLWGLDPKMFHFFNILFHLAGAVVLYLFIYKLTGRYETAAIVSLLFAVHPMHVGVVTWVSQTKTSLYFIFYMLALIQYLKYVREGFQIRHLFYVSLYFVLSALSKPSAVTLAPMLFLLDYYLSRKLNIRLFIEKIPIFMIAAFFGFLTLWTHSETNDTIFNINHNYSLINNILISNYSIVFYINKLFIPLNLSAIYPYPDNAALLPFKYYFSVLVIPLILVLIHKSGTFRKEMIFGILFFSISISVLIRFVPSGFFSVANRYSYMSYTGLFFIIAQYFTFLLDNKFAHAVQLNKYLFATFAIFVIFISYRTTIRVSKWQNSITLFDDVIKKSQRVPIAYNNRALAKLQKGDRDGAFDDFSMALKLDTAYTEAYVNRGLINYNKGKYDEALHDYNKSLKLNPKLGAAYFNRALVKMKKEDRIGTMEDLKMADSLDIAQAKGLIDQLNAILNAASSNAVMPDDETRTATELLNPGSTH